MNNTLAYVVNATFEQRLVSLFKSVATCCDGVKIEPNDMINMPKVPFLTKNSRQQYVNDIIKLKAEQYSAFFICCLVTEKSIH